MVLQKDQTSSERVAYTFNECVQGGITLGFCVLSPPYNSTYTHPHTQKYLCVHWYVAEELGTHHPIQPPRPCLNRGMEESSVNIKLLYIRRRVIHCLHPLIYSQIIWLIIA